MNKRKADKWIKEGQTLTSLGKLGVPKETIREYLLYRRSKTNERAREKRRVETNAARGIVEVKLGPGKGTGAPTVAQVEQQVEQHRGRKADQQRKLSAGAREIGPIPAVVNPERRQACSENLILFCTTYLTGVFYAPMSDDHLQLLRTLQSTVKHGGQFAFLFPRGHGKTSCILAAVLFALAYGFRHYVAVVAAGGDQAEDLVKTLRDWLETNELLLEDFPEICFPVRALDGINNRASGQTCEGERTKMSMRGKLLRLPTIEGSVASGGLIQAAGITSGMRGMLKSGPNNTVIRPDLVLVDDPQTESSASSRSQVATRERIIQSAVLNLGGPGVKIAALAAVTQIEDDDVAARLLDRSRHPEWHGRRVRLLISPPADGKLWDTYWQVRRTELQADRGHDESNNFYKQHRLAMDAGAEVSWEYRKYPDELSAIQHAMNLRYKDPVMFGTEFQGCPVKSAMLSRPLTMSALAGKITGAKRGVVPGWANFVTWAADPNDNLIYWTVCAWDENGRGALVDWGTYPEQPILYFNLHDANPTLSSMAPGMNREGYLLTGLQTLVGQIRRRDFVTDKAVLIPLYPMLCDNNWSEGAFAVRQVALENDGVFLPSHGRYINVTKTPMFAYKAKPGEMIGDYWRLRPPKEGGVRYVVHDSNHYKSVLAEKMLAPLNDLTGFEFCGTSQELQLLLDHCLAEERRTVEGPDRVVEEWKIKSNKPDNHYFDTLVYNAVAADMLGCTSQTLKPSTKEKERAQRTKRQNVDATIKNKRVKALQM